MRRAIFLCAATTLLAGFPFPSYLTAQPPGQKPKLDLYGDPLPSGASLRLGSIAFRNRVEAPSLAFRPDGKAVAVPDGDYVKIWELATGKVVQVFRIDPPAKGSEWRYCSVAYSPDGSLLLASVGIRTPKGQWFAADRVLVWDAESGRLRRSLMQPDANVYAYCFCGDNRTIAIAEGERMALWDVATGHRTNESSAKFDDNPMSLVYDSSSNRLVSGHVNGDVRVWKLAGLERISKSNKTFALWEVATSGEGKLVAAGGAELILWNAGVATKLPVSTGEPWNRGALSVAFSPDGSLMASSHRTGDVFVWEMPGAKVRHVLRGQGTVRFSPDGKILACADVCDLGIRFWDSRTGERLFRPTGHVGTVHAVAFSPTGDRLGSAGDDHTVRIWDPTSGKELSVHRDSGGGRSVAWSPDGAMFASGAQAYDAKDGKPRRRYSEGPQADDVAFSRDGKFVAADRSELRWWDAKSGRLLGKCAPVEFPRLTAVAPDGSRAVSWGSDPKIGQAIVFWDLVANRRLHAIPGQGFDIALAISPDSKLVACAAGSVRLFPLADVTGSGFFGRSPTDVVSVAFASHGKILALGRENETVELWDVDAQRRIMSLRAHQGAIASLSFSPDGKRLATGGADSTVLLWPLNDILGSGDGGMDSAALWQDLGQSEDLRLVHRAIIRLAARPKDTVPFLRERLKPQTPLPAERLARLLADLEADSFAVREKATRQLIALDNDLVALGLKKLQKSAASPEVARRAAGILERTAHVSDDARRPLRAVLVLEAIGAPDAVGLLDELSRGAPGARLTREARAALERLDERRKATSR